MERWPGRQKRSTTDFPSALAAANGDPARPNARVDRRKGKHLICLAHFPSPLRSPLTLSAPAGSISLFLSRSDRFAFDTHGYVRAVRVENGGCQFLFLRSKDSRRVVAMPWYFGGYRTKRTRGYRGGVLIKMSISWMIPRKILIKRHVDEVLDFSSFLDFSFFWLLWWKAKKRKGSDVAREESRAIFWIRDSFLSNYRDWLRVARCV